MSTRTTISSAVTNRALRRWWWLLLIGLVALASCGGSGGNAEIGAKLFSGELPFGSPDAPSCTICHNIDPSQGAGIGPNLAGVGSAAATRVPGQSAEEYLRTALINTDAYLVNGYQEGIMYRGYAQALSQNEINDLVAFLLTLK